MYTALFDFDAVVMDTETQYSVFWNSVGKKYFADKIRPRSRTEFDADLRKSIFKGMEEEQVHRNLAALNRFETEMTYDYIWGDSGSMYELREKKVKIAIVTSSNEKKDGKCICSSSGVERGRPGLAAELFALQTRSRLFLAGCGVFDTEPCNCVAF